MDTLPLHIFSIIFFINAAAMFALPIVTIAEPMDNKPTRDVPGSHKKLSALDQLNMGRVSFDAFNTLDSSGNAIIGNGSGDLVLIMLDESGKSPRKKSFMLDLSFFDNEGNLNDLTVNDIQNLSSTVAIRAPELNSFIKKSKEPENILWLMAGIADHTFSILGDFQSLKFINSGIVITETSMPKAPLSYNDIHLKQVFIKHLIEQNNFYGLEENGAFTSFSSESSFFIKDRYGYLSDGNPIYSKLSSKLFLSNHQKRLCQIQTNPSLSFCSDFNLLAAAKIIKHEDEYQIFITPEI